MGYFVVSPVVGTGGFIRDPESGQIVFDPYRLSVSLYGNYVAVIDPAKPFGIAFTEGRVQDIDADSSQFRLNENRLDRTVNSAMANVVNARLAEYGAPALIQSGMTIRDAITAIGDYIQPGWVMQDFYVSP